MKFGIAFACTVAVFGGNLAWAADPAAARPANPERSIEVIGRTSVTVTSPDIRLSDVAAVSSRRSEDDDAVIALKKLVVGKSPQPGTEQTIEASTVVETLRRAGVKFETVGYMFPKQMKVLRASREINEAEIAQAIEEYLKSLGSERAVRRIPMRQALKVSPGDTQIRVTEYPIGEPGKAGFQLVAMVDGLEEARTRVVAEVDEWREFPTAKRPLPKGSTVEAGDVIMARMNIQALPKDAAAELSDIVGLETTKDIGSGEVFRKNKLFTPPVISAGSKISLVYRSGLFEATASAIAMESGASGQIIKVRNENSKKIVTGTVVDAGMVEVK